MHLYVLFVCARVVQLGDSWIAPVICMQSYGPYLLETSEINEVEAANLTAYATEAAAAVDAV